MRLSPRLMVLLLLGALLPLYARASAAPLAQTIDAVPADFADTLVASVASPTALAFTPDGRMLITTQPGRLRMYQNGALLATPALDLSSRLCTNSERGLLGVAVDPSFASNRFIYLYYTFNKNNTCANNTATSPVNRVSRFVLPDSNVIDAATEVVLVDNMPSPNGNHNAGDLQFGKDGFLYVSIGDGGCDYAGDSGCAGANDATRDQHVLTGKILRITRDGGIPPGNPFTGANTARCNVTGRTNAGWRCQETFAWGLRNPFRFGFNSNAATTRFFINDVGQGAWEEIDQAQAGADYGWNCREGAHTNSTSGLCNPTPPNMIDPIYEYGRSTGCASITGGAFVPNGVWPSDYDGDYMFADYVCGKIFRLQPNGSGGYNASDFATGLGGSSAVHLTFGPHGATQALYYTTYAGGGQVRRVAYTGVTNRPPTADIAASPTSGAAPLAVSFNGSGSSDPDGDALTYIWNFGDGSPTRETSTATTSYTYNTIGAYTASLVVRDSRGAVSTADTIRIDVGNTAPTPAISAPTPTKQFFVGETITLSGSATDPQDGTLPSSALSWQVLLHHDTHTHPFLGPVAGNNITFTAPAPEDLAGAQTSYLEIQLTATNSQGLGSTITQNLQPHKVNVSFNSAPAGLRVVVNGTNLTGPQTVVSWERYVLNVNAPNQTDSTGRSWEFQSWSDGGAQAHAITTPATAATYTATFREVSGGTGTGLTGVYYNNIDFTGTRVQRVDPTVNFDWGTGAPAPGIGADTFSVRWIGQVQPRYSQTYTFYTLSDNGVRLWVNGQQLVNNWTEHALTENSGTIALTAGQKYVIAMEFYDNTGGAVAKLSWSSSSQAKEIIPQSQLYPQFSGRVNFQPAASPVPAGYQPDGGAVYAARGNGNTYGWNADNSAQARDRNAANAPDQRYDTLNHLQKPAVPNAVWEIGVPNGTYSVRIVSGDASNFDSVFRLNAEGTLAVSGTPTSATRWIEGTVSVVVSDGRLTISNGSGASNNKICFVEITGQ